MKYTESNCKNYKQVQYVVDTSNMANFYTSNITTSRLLQPLRPDPEAALIAGVYCIFGPKMSLCSK